MSLDRPALQRCQAVLEDVIEREAANPGDCSDEVLYFADGASKDLAGLLMTPRHGTP